MLVMAQVRRVLLGPASTAMLGPLLATKTVPLFSVQCALPPCAQCAGCVSRWAEQSTAMLGPLLATETVVLLSVQCALHPLRARGQHASDHLLQTMLTKSTGYQFFIPERGFHGLPGATRRHTDICACQFVTQPTG